jgi:hypothetical protein
VLEDDFLGEGRIEAFLHGLACEYGQWLLCMPLGLYDQNGVEMVFVEDPVELIASNSHSQLSILWLLEVGHSTVSILIENLINIKWLLIRDLSAERLSTKSIAFFCLNLSLLAQLGRKVGPRVDRW